LTLCAQGVRFFDFRPAYSLHDIVDEVKGELRHQHAIVAGLSYEFFLIDVLAFLAENREEVVVVELKDDGALLSLFLPLFPT
jgi:hypothetical protein